MVFSYILLSDAEWHMRYGLFLCFSNKQTNKWWNGDGEIIQLQFVAFFVVTVWFQCFLEMIDSEENLQIYLAPLTQSWTTISIHSLTKHCGRNSLAVDRPLLSLTNFARSNYALKGSRWIIRLGVSVFSGRTSKRSSDVSHAYKARAVIALQQTHQTHWRFIHIPRDA